MQTVRRRRSHGRHPVGGHRQRAGATLLRTTRVGPRRHGRTPVARPRRRRTPTAEVLRYRRAVDVGRAGRCAEVLRAASVAAPAGRRDATGNAGGAGAGAQPAVQRVADDRTASAPRPRCRGPDRPPAGTRDVRRSPEGDPADAVVVVHPGDGVARSAAGLADRRHRRGRRRTRGRRAPRRRRRLASRAHRTIALRRRRADGGRNRVPRPRSVRRASAPS